MKRLVSILAILGLAVAACPMAFFAWVFISILLFPGGVEDAPAMTMLVCPGAIYLGIMFMGGLTLWEKDTQKEGRNG